jgi:hypothetical protein
MVMRNLNVDECGLVAGGDVCDYAGLDTMLNTSGAVGAVAGMAGFALGGPTVGGIAGAGAAAGALMAFGFYNFYILGYDLLGGCTGYTGEC